ncbi:MAG: ATP-binding cassette domain-containing protein, partial [Geminicoccaceae bacterium]|nr:ATP-binding cassette domain-containing protein [Geminicoccaceae bacterium]
QDYHLFEELSALGNAGLAASFAPAADREHIRRGAGQWLDRLGLGGMGGRSVASFSGGERQRIAVARALAGEPPIVLADEPTASLDRAAADALAGDLAGLGRSGKRTLIAVTHDAALASLLDRQLTIVDGRIVEDSDG